MYEIWNIYVRRYHQVQYSSRGRYLSDLWFHIVKNLRFTFESFLKLDLQSLALKKKSSSVLAFLNNLEKVIHAFIASRLDYCSSLYIRLGEALLSLLCTRSKMLLVNRLLTSGWKHFTHAGIVTLALWFVYSLISSCIGLPLRAYQKGNRFIPHAECLGQLTGSC